MKVYPPSAALAPFVREFMVVDVQDETTRLRLPEPGLVLGVRYARLGQRPGGRGGHAASGRVAWPP